MDKFHNILRLLSNEVVHRAIALVGEDILREPLEVTLSSQVMTASNYKKLLVNSIFSLNSAYLVLIPRIMNNNFDWQMFAQTNVHMFHLINTININIMTSFLP